MQLHKTIPRAEYLEQTTAYGKKDALLALGCYLGITVLYYLEGMVLVYRGERQLLGEFDVFFGAGGTAALAVGLVLLLCRLRKQGLATVGFGKTGAARSLFLGLVLSAAIVAIRGLPELAAVQSQWPLFLSQAVFYLVFIALAEELIFRGYLGTRLYGFFQNKRFAVWMVAVLFAVEHIPMQLLKYHYTLPQYLARFWPNLIFYAAFHLVAQWLYSRHNSIIAPVLVHFTYNYTNWFGKL